MARFFVSFATPDHAIASAVLDRLERRGHVGFLDRDISRGIGVGEPWKQRLRDELRLVDAVVCIVSGESVASTWCTAEIAIAGAVGCPIIPVQIRPDVVHPLLDDLQHALHHVDQDHALEMVLQRLADLDASGSPMWHGDSNPFPGLEPFTVARSAVFHGRSAETRELVRRLAMAVGPRAGLLTVVGPSGCGKSSLLGAGLLHAITGDRQWVVLPTWRPGADPLTSLARSLTVAARARGLGWEIGDVRISLDTESDALAPLAAEILASDLGGDRQRLLIPIDQGEELFTRAAPAARARTLTALRAALAGDARVVMTLRSEFLDDLRTVRALSGVPIDAQVIAPLGKEALRTVVEGPARAAGMRLDPGLAQRMVDETGSGRALPLLAFTLHGLADGVGRGGRLTAERYEFLGGVRGALAQHADHALEESVTASGLMANEVVAVLTRTVGVDDDGRRAARRIPVDGLTGPQQVAVQVLVDARLLALETDEEGSWLAVVHEALITAWEPLDKASRGLTDALRGARAVEQAAKEWNEAGRSDTYLWERDRLATARERLVDPRGDLVVDTHPLALEFLGASEIASHRTDRRERARRRATVVGLAVVAMLAVTVAVLAIRQLSVVQQSQRVVAAASLLNQATEVERSDPQRALRLVNAAHLLAPDRGTQDALVAILQTTSEYRSTLTGHTGAVRSAAFSPDGRMLATAGDEIRMWDVSDPDRPHPVGDPLPTHRGEVRAVAFATGGATMVSAGEDGRVVIWDVSGPGPPVETGAVVALVPSAVTALSVSADGRLLAFVQEDGHLSTVDISRRSRPEQLAVHVPAHDGAALSVAFSATDQVLATTGQDGTLLIWSMVDPSAPQRVGQAASSDGSAINSVAAYPGRADLLATGGADGRALLWSTADPQSGPTVLTEAIVRDGPVTQVGFRQGGLRTELVAASADQSITLVDLTDPTTIDGEPTELRGHSSDVVSVAVRADGLVLASGGADSDVILWNPDRRRSGYLGPVRRFEGAATAITGEIEFVRGDDTIVTTGPEGTIPIWRASGVQPSGAAPGAPKGDAVRSSDFAEEGSLLATTDGSSVTIWDTTDPLQAQRFGTLDARARYTTIALSSDGTLLAVGTEDGAVDLWSVSTPTSPRRLSTVTTYEDRATAVAFGAEGRLATSGDEGTVDLWDVTDPGQPERRGGPWTEHAQPVLAIAFNSTGSTFVTAGEDSQAILWSATDTPGMLGRPLGGHTLGVSDARFAARDQYLITIDGDRSVVLWDVVETARPARIGELLQTDPGETPRTMDIAASEDLVAVGAESGVVYLLALSDLDLVRDRAVGDACLHAGQLDVEEWEAAVPGIGFEPTCEGR